MKIKQDINAPTIISSTVKFSPFVVSIDTYPVSENTESNSQETDKDAIFDIYTSETHYLEGWILVSNSLNTVFKNLTPDICSLSEDGHLTRLSSGHATISVTDGSITKLIKLDMRTRGGAEIKIFNSAIPGSLMSHCIEQIDSRLDGMIKSENIYLYSSQNHTTRTFIRHPNCWLTRSDNDLVPIDLTKISPSNSRGNHLRAGTLITPRHVIGAAHYPKFNGDKIYFVTQDGNNTTIERTIIGSVTHPNYSNYHPDLRVYTLNSDIPNTITPCKTLPFNYQDYLFHIGHGRPPTIGLDQEEKGLVSDLYLMNTLARHHFPTDTKRLQFFETKVSGDSGNPSFLVINNELVLLTCWTFGGSGSGTSVPYYLNDINNLMIPAADSQAGIPPTGYTLQTVDLSMFPSFA